MKSRIRVLLADDHLVIRSGLRHLFEQEDGIEVVAETENAEQAYEMFNELLPDVLVMDMSMPGIGGLEALIRILVRHPNARIMIFSMHDDVTYAMQALTNGAMAYVENLQMLLMWFKRLEEWLQAKTS